MNLKSFLSFLTGLFFLSANAQQESDTLLGQEIDSFQVSIDYNIPITLLVELGNYGYADEEISEATYPFQLVPRKEKNNMYVMRYPRPMSSDSALYYLEQNGYVPASLRQLLFFGIAYSEYQKKVIVTSLAPANGIPGSPMVPVIEEERSPQSKKGNDVERKGRELLLAEWEGDWRPGTGFLGVKKEITLDTLGEIIYDDLDITALSSICVLDKGFKKIKIAVPSDKKGKTSRVFLLKASFEMSLSSLPMHLKGINKNLKPASLIELLAIKNKLEDRECAVIAQTLAPGQPPGTIAQMVLPNCNIQLIGVTPAKKIGPEFYHLYIIPGIKK